MTEVYFSWPTMLMFIFYFVMIGIKLDRINETIKKEQKK